ncbi:hypothetical protein [Marinobacterium marinum]|uniref:Uncharacterized protein n=1 Tax=Marinobacterium marinum TaxID=2756129 RepID=A0A7W2AC61_9GAMM|nr:hypothetical protein [Marinobacterium marinum]MBA4501808.1 hypothetical protein [Marinobacterium marinum]
MSRNKKTRKAGAFMTVLERKPKKQERLADPTSKESRRKKALDERKKHTSIAERKRDATMSAQERDTRAGRKGTRHGGPLADKIRKLNADKREQEQTADE